MAAVLKHSWAVWQVWDSKGWEMKSFREKKGGGGYEIHNAKENKAWEEQWSLIVSSVKEKWEAIMR